jgi:hypothetical protein
MKASVVVTKDGKQIASRTKALAVDEVIDDSFEIATGVTEGDYFPANLTTATFLYIESDQTLTIFYTTSETANTLTKQGFQIHVDTSFTTLLITNGSGTTANVRLVVAGT